MSSARSPCGRPSDASLIRGSGEWIEYFYPEPAVITDIAGCDDQIVDCGGRGNHRVFNEVVRLPMHETRPGPKCPGVHYEDVVTLGNLLKPQLELGGFFGVLLARELNSRLNLPDRHCRDV